MNLLQIINQNEFEPQDYSERKTVRIVLLNEDRTKVLFFGTHLVGGGVEEGESDEDAVKREAMEEAGVRVEILESVGEVIAYRDFLKKKYVVHGYLCKQVGDFVTPTSTDPEERGMKIAWIDIPFAIQKMEDQIHSLMEQATLPITDDILQSRINNCKTSLVILKEATKSIS